VEEIQKAEPLITASRTEQVKLLVERLQEKLGQHSNHTFYLFKVRHVSKALGRGVLGNNQCFIDFYFPEGSVLFP
jgi:dynein assembly factor with WDR repeat domains 1